MPTVSNTRKLVEDLLDRIAGVLDITSRVLKVID